MNPRLVERRLPWLLVFRAAVAFLLCGLTISADLFNWPLARMSTLLYGVAFASVLLILVLALMLRAHYAPLVVATAHLVAGLMGAVMVVQATGGVTSVFSFLLILVVLDAAIIGGRSTAVVLASLASLAYGVLVAAQLYEVFAPTTVSVYAFASAIVAHVAAFYLMALLAGHLADQFEHASSSVDRAREELERAEKLQAAIAGSLPVGVITVDGAGLVHSCNRMACEIFAVDRGSFQGSLLAEYIAVPAVGEAVQLEVQAGGKAKWLSLRRVPIARPAAAKPAGQSAPGASLTDEAGDLELVLIEDRTEVHELEQDLRTRDRLASVGELAASIAHEIRNPLAAISGAAELLAATPDLQATETRLQKIILREIDRLDILVTNFLLYARPADPVFAAVSVSQLANELREGLEGESQWQLRPLKIDVPELPRARLDAGQVYQLLSNLLRNAVEASAPGSPVTLSARTQGCDLIIAVRDQGEGIDPAVREHIFEPFRSTRRGGNGLGLAVVHRLAQGHGARILIDSTRGGGTTVEVVFPKACEAPPPERPRVERGLEAEGSAELGGQ